MSNNIEILKSKLMQVTTDLDNLKDFVKISAIDGKIDNRVAIEVIRMIDEAYERCL